MSATLLTGPAIAQQQPAAQELSETRRTANVDIAFDIALITNPSTGFEWLVNEAASQGLQRVSIEELGTSAIPCEDGKALVGAPVIRSWLVTPLARGTARFVLDYVRRGDDEPPLKTHTFVFEIE